MCIWMWRFRSEVCEVESFRITYNDVCIPTCKKRGYFSFSLKCLYWGYSKRFDDMFLCWLIRKDCAASAYKNARSVFQLDVSYVEDCGRVWVSVPLEWWVLPIFWRHLKSRDECSQCRFQSESKVCRNDQVLVKVIYFCEKSLFKA